MRFLLRDSGLCLSRVGAGLRASRSPSSLKTGLRRASALLFILLAQSRLRAAEGGRITVVLENGSRSHQAVLNSLAQAAQGRLELRVRRLDEVSLGDPILRGRFIADLQRSDLVVPVGDEPTRLVLGEIEGIPICFIGAGLVPGENMKSPDVAGILSYNIGRV